MVDLGIFSLEATTLFSPCKPDKENGHVFSLIRKVHGSLLQASLPLEYLPIIFITPKCNWVYIPKSTCSMEYSLYHSIKYGLYAGYVECIRESKMEYGSASLRTKGYETVECL